MSSILKVWLRFPDDVEDSYTSLPCTSEMVGSELAERIQHSVEKKRGIKIEVLGELATNAPGASNVWHVALKTSGALLKFGGRVLPQLEAQEKELMLVLAPQATYSIGQCIYEDASWCPAQAFITYLVSAGQLPVDSGVAFSRRCSEDGIVGLMECVTGLAESEADLDALKATIGPERHAQVIQTLEDITAGTMPDALQALLKPAKRKGGHRMRSIIVTDSHHVLATVHSVPKRPLMVNPDLRSIDAPMFAAPFSPSVAAAPSPATAAVSSHQRATGSAGSIGSMGSTPSPSASPSPLLRTASSSPAPTRVGSTDGRSPSPAPIDSVGGTLSAYSSRSPTSTLPKPPFAPASLKVAGGKNVEVVVDAGVLVERVQEWSTVTYEVVKINERGRRQARILRLTPTQIQNVKDADTISSRHSYEDVFCVTLADHETLVISYHESHDYTYVSPVALQIVGDINERISKKREKQKTSNLHALAIRFQEKALRRPAQSVSSTASSSSDDTCANTAAAAAEMEKDLAMLALAGADGDTFSLNPLDTIDLPPPTRPPPTLQSAPSKSTLKLQQLFGSTHQQRLQLAIDTIILETTSDAGRARARFLRNFDALEKKPTTMLSVVRGFMDSLRNFVESKRIEEIRRVTGLTLNASPTEGEDELLTRIERSVEGGVVMPAYQRIMTVLRKQSAVADEAISSQLTALRMKVGPDQSFYGIADADRNINNWSAAVEEINDMDKKLLPCEKLHCLLSAAKTIYTTVRTEAGDCEVHTQESSAAVQHEGSPFRVLISLFASSLPPSQFNHDRVRRSQLAGRPPKPGQYFLSADDFFPIFVFVIAQSRLAHLETSKQFMWGLCDKSALNGEGGYYLTVFEAAAEYIKNMTIAGHTPRGASKAS